MPEKHPAGSKAWTRARKTPRRQWDSSPWSIDHGTSWAILLMPAVRLEPTMVLGLTHPSINRSHFLFEIELVLIQSCNFVPIFVVCIFALLSFLISELSSPNFNSSRAGRSCAIRYLNVVIKPLCGNLDICLNYYFRSRNPFACFRSRITTRKWKMLFGSRFSVALLRNLADLVTEIHFGREKPEHANAPRRSKR